MLDKQTLSKLNEFMNIEGRKFLYYHRDCDGVCSAALLTKYYPGFTAITKKGPRLTEEALNTMIRKKPDLVVFLDLPVDQERKSLTKFQKAVPSAKIVIIDHHVFEKNLDSKNVIHINPLFTKNVYQSASYIVYTMLKKTFGPKVKRFSWIAMMGAIGDYDLADSQDLVKECGASYPNLLDKNPPESELAKGAKLLGAIITLKSWKGAQESLDILTKAETYDDFSSVKKLKDYEREVDKEFKRTVEKAKREEVPECNLLMMEIETDLSLVSPVSNYFSEKYPKKIILIRKHSGTEWKFSVRFQEGKINLGEIVKKAVKGIGSGGGHPKAAAGLTEDWDGFRRNFIRELKHIKGRAQL
jgi:single-stranded DNA-specific DHH superfamily exonuclease